MVGGRGVGSFGAGSCWSAAAGARVDWASTLGIRCWWAEQVRCSHFLGRHRVVLLPAQQQVALGMLEHSCCAR